MSVWPASPIVSCCTKCSVEECKTEREAPGDQVTALQCAARPAPSPVQEALIQSTAREVGIAMLCGFLTTGVAYGQENEPDRSVEAVTYRFEFGCVPSPVEIDNAVISS